ncbi:MAG: hypothetical protein KF691_01250 [Phycisphaeraceae bacterium]|nr:hypothetical protein [Phycisphaeraceae bacterium]
MSSPSTPQPNRFPDLNTALPSPDFVALITFEFAWRYRVCAVSMSDTEDLLVTTADTPLSIIARIADRLPKFCHQTEASEEEVLDLIGRAYERPRST